jgi:gliding motility-associated-like protein
MQSVFVLQTPTGFALTASPSVISAGESAQLTANGGGTYSWSPDSTLSCSTCANPIASPTQTTTYCVTVTDTNGCVDSACIKITVEIPCGEIFVPTAFSPNNDGSNELECVTGGCISSFHFAIYDRWGEKVFESTSQDLCWDGMYKGKLMNTAVFVYYLDVTYTNGETVKQKGNITLVR